LWLVRVLYPAPQGAPAPVDPGTIRKLLVIRIDTRVGNVLLTTPLLRALRASLPSARVDFLVAEGKQALVEGLADRVVGFGKKDFFRAPLRFWRRVLALRKERYDVAIEAGHWHAFSFTSLWLARFTRAPVRVGHRRGLAERFLTHAVAKDETSEREVPAKLELLGPLGLRPDGEALDTTVDRDPSVARRAEAILAGCGGAAAALNPGGRKADHRWPPSAFGRLARRIREELGLCPLVLWGPGEEAIAAEVVAASGGAALLAPPTDLALLAGVFRRSALVVTNGRRGEGLGRDAQRGRRALVARAALRRGRGAGRVRGGGRAGPRGGAAAARRRPHLVPSAGDLAQDGKDFRVQEP
jgi:ADP-heptose:LPS heptosyltransferase